MTDEVPQVQICTRGYHEGGPCNGLPRPECPGYPAWASAEIERLKKELGRAYRALHGFYYAFANGETPKPMVGYHSLTIAAARRYMTEKSYDGTEYFVGKHVDVLREVLKGYKRE